MTHIPSVIPSVSFKKLKDIENKLIFGIKARGPQDGQNYPLLALY